MPACMCVFGIQSKHVYQMGPLKQTLWWVRSSVCVCVSACMLMCVWYTEPTCIPYWASRTDIEGQVLGPSMCRQMVGPLLLPGALNHLGRYLPKGPTICILCACGGATPIAGHP